MNSAKKWMGVTLLATLSIGVGAGVLIDRFLLASAAHTRSADRSRREPGEHRNHGGRMVERLRSGLDLTDEQVTQLTAVMNENHEIAREFWGNSRREYEALRGQFRADIRALLNDEQRVKFDAMVAEDEDKNQKDRERRRRD
jgi:Spy/CpxP family protein refolding chaperone